YQIVDNFSRGQTSIKLIYELMLFMARYAQDFKRVIVDLHQTGRSVRGLSKEYALSEATIYTRKHLYTLIHSTGLTGKETAELRKENARLKEELEILKKAAAIFSRKI